MSIHMGRYWVMRRGTWHERVMVEAESPNAAQKLAKEIPDEVWAASRVLVEPKTRMKGYSLGGVSLSDTRQPWRPDEQPERDPALAVIAETLTVPGVVRTPSKVINDLKRAGYSIVPTPGWVPERDEG